MAAKDVIRVFVGCAPNHDDAESQAVLEWSLRKNTKAKVEIEWMKLSRDPLSPWYSNGAEGWQTSAWATPFSGFRWAIPAVCGWKGRAIYMDSDMIVLGNIADLWKQPIEAPAIALAKGGRSWRYCVSLWDCARAKLHLHDLEVLQANPASHRQMNAMMTSRPELTRSFVGDWNCLDGDGHDDLDDGELKILHYTDMSSQPQQKHAIPRLAKAGRTHWYNGRRQQHPRSDVQELFDYLLEEATANGFGVERYVQEPIYGDFIKKDLTNYAGRIGS